MDSLQAFSQLKTLLLRQYRQVYPHYRGDLQQFRQADILNFQLLLEEKVQARVSEKWFYTHLKPATNEKLPRIDTLNLLARFVGFDSWDAYYHSLDVGSTQVRPKNFSWWWMLTLPVVGLLWVGLGLNATQELKICMVDAIRQTAITEQTVQLELIAEGYSSQLFNTDEKGCLSIPHWRGKAQLIFTAPYYLPDTLQLPGEYLPEEQMEVPLRTDDYALMIHYFSNSKVADWKRRRTQLEAVFADDAIIYQVDPNGQLGMDILNKREFINKLTIPINSLRNVEVLQTIYAGEQIVELRFRVKD